MIHLQDVELVFPRRGPKSIRDRISRAFGVGPHITAAEPGSVQALRGVTLTIERGERVGIIGPNGAGKTTLLKSMCGIYAPTAGRATIEGEVACLFELATGFEMEANGWDNIRTRGLLLGLTTREIRARAKEIAEFTELGSALDRPVKTYSMGMFYRLAFAVSTSISPDVLLLDEVMASGDLHFEEKAQRRLEQLVDRASILVLVSHVMGAIRRMCGRCVWMEQGGVRMDGPVADVIAAYEQSELGSPRPA